MAPPRWRDPHRGPRQAAVLLCSNRKHDRDTLGIRAIGLWRRASKAAAAVEPTNYDPETRTHHEPKRNEDHKQAPECERNGSIQYYSERNSRASPDPGADPSSKSKQRDLRALAL